ncbi:MAG: ATP-binding protein [Phormidesmis sp.]
MQQIEREDNEAQSSHENLDLRCALKTCQQALSDLQGEHQQTLEKHQQVEDALRSSQQQLQLVMDTLPEAIFWKDRNLVYLGCNQNFAEDAGLSSPTEIVGKTDYDMPWKTEEADFFRQCDRRVMNSNRAELGIIEPQMHSDGEQTWVETNKAPLQNINGSVVGILGTYQDITRRRKTEIELQALNHRLQHQTIQLNSALNELRQSQLLLVQTEKMSALGNLVAGVAHEINNPLGFLVGNLDPAQSFVADLLGLVDLYQQAFPNPGEAILNEIETIDLNYIREDLPKLLVSMKEGARRIRGISTSLRTFSRADTAKPTDYNIHEGINSTLMILKHRLKATDYRPEIEAILQYGRLPMVECFAGQLNQVFMNILANAIDAIEESSQENRTSDLQSRSYNITITTEVSDDKQQAHIRIADNGAGIPTEILPKIFEQYFTTKSVGKGTGIGLALSHQIVTKTHGGQLSVSSGVGKGTEFVISLPIAAA